MRRNLVLSFLTAVGIVVTVGSCVSAEKDLLKDWRAEDASGKMQISVSGDTLDIISPDGVTLWYLPRLTGNYEISYKACMVMNGADTDRLSDLNCFWGANDPASPDDLFANAEWRNGIFPRYKSLTLFYVGYGGNHNTTTRFRKYYGQGAEVPDETARPVIAEYTDAEHLLKPNRWYSVRIVVKDGMTAYYVDDECLFSRKVEAGEADGNFALRLLQNHVLIASFKVSSLQ